MGDNGEAGGDLRGRNYRPAGRHRLTSNETFHKLTYIVRREVVKGEGNYYWKVMEGIC